MGTTYSVHLNVQTNSNLSFSLIKIPELVDLASENKLEYLAITDYYPYDFLLFYNLCKEKSIKPIIGIKVIIQEQSEDKKYLLTIYPQNNAGYKELLKVVFNGDSPKDRTFSLDNLFHLKKDCLFVFTAHNINDISYFLQKQFFMAETKDKSQFYIGFDFCIQEPKKHISSHTLPFLLPFFSVKTLSREDAMLLGQLKLTSLEQHFLSADIQQKFISYLDEEKFSLVCSKDKYFYKIVSAQLKTFQQKINLKISFSEGKAKSNKDDLMELKARCERQLFFLEEDFREQYEIRLDKELQIINKLGYANYFLIFSNIVNELRKRQVIIGPGRGSAVSSLVAYLLEITKINPLEYDLFFERFLNEKRKNPPDIDIDVDNQKSVIAYLQEKYGKEKIARIATRQKLGWKKAFQEIIKIVNHNKTKPIIDEFRSKEILSCVKNENLDENLKTKALRDRFAYLFFRAQKLKDFYFNESIHASGFAISDKKNLVQFLPLKKDKECLVSYYSEYGLNLTGLKKYDFLNLSSLSALRDIKSILNMEQLPKCNLQDKKTFNLLNNCLLTGIPQLDTISFHGLINKFKIKSFSDLVLILALNRPGAKQNIDLIHYRKNQSSKEQFNSSTLNQILNETYGFIVFEEQISQLLAFVFDYSFAEAEIQRRELLHLTADKAENFKQNFFQQTQKKLTQLESKKLWEQIISSNSYTFNKAHAVAYSYLSYYFAFLKANFFSSLITSFLNNCLNSSEKTLAYLQEAFVYEFDVQKPDINLSEIQWSKKNKTLQMGFASLKHFQPDVFEKIIIERQQKNKFIGWEDFISRTGKQNVWEKVELPIFKKWIEIGLFESLGISIDYLLENCEIILRYCKLKQTFSANSHHLPPLIWSINKKTTDQKIINQREWETFEFYVSYLSFWKIKKSTDPSLKSFSEVSQKNIDKREPINIKILSVICDIQLKNRFVWITLCDIRSKLQVAVNNDFYQNNKDILNVHQTVFFYLTVTSNIHEAQNIQVKKIEKL